MKFILLTRNEEFFHVELASTMQGLLLAMRSTLLAGQDACCLTSINDEKKVEEFKKFVVETKQWFLEGKLTAEEAYERILNYGVTGFDDDIDKHFNEPLWVCRNNDPDFSFTTPSIDNCDAVVCPNCHGEGKVLPEAFRGVLEPETLEDTEFMEDLQAGRFDQVCVTCKGRRVISKEAYQTYKDDAEWRRESEMERRMLGEY